MSSFVGIASEVFYAASGVSPLMVSDLVEDLGPKIALNGFSIRWPNNVTSFSSGHGVYVNNISMVHD